MRKNSKQSLIVLLMTLCLILTSIGIVPTYGSDDKRVLIINSYHYGLSWTDDINTSLIDVIQSNYGNNVRIYVEYMDWKEYPTEAALNQFEQSMIYKYR